MSFISLDRKCLSCITYRSQTVDECVICLNGGFDRGVISDSDGSRPVPPAGSTRFAPDPVSKMKKSKQKKCEGRQAKAIHKF
jgi:hypothetical protein